MAEPKRDLADVPCRLKRRADRHLRGAEAALERIRLHQRPDRVNVDELAEAIDRL